MSDYSENGESPVSDSSQRGQKLSEAVREAIEGWVADESIEVECDGDDIIADEDELVENISVMIAIALDEAAD
jgi:hypothetical protein